MIYTVPATVNALEAPAFAPVLAKPLAGLPFVGLVTVDAEIVAQLTTVIWSHNNIQLYKRKPDIMTVLLIVGHYPIRTVLQGDTSRCSKPPVDTKTKVAF